MKITIVTATYNSSPTLADCLQSVNSQTYPFEHIIVDGASEDNTLELIHNLSPVARILSEPDYGIYDAMNKGIALATGDIVGFINSDDVYADNEVLKRVVELFTDNPEIHACYGDLCYVKRDDISSVVRYWRSCEYMDGLFEKGWAPPHPTFYVRKSVYCDYGGFDLSYKIAADFELMLRFMKVHKVNTMYLPHNLVKMRLGGVTNRSYMNILRQNLEIRRALSKHKVRSSLISYLANKLWTRIQQFSQRPQ
ncbi:MAG: glycosyltransferase family 2 protein [Geobacteraceae bacterium]|nr:glycosyltransferase family 2 protein [Geobacteraceae bacterium]